MDSKNIRLIKNIFLLFTGNFVAKVLSFLMVPFYTAYLTTSEYGISDLISTTVLLVLPAFSLLMDEAIMRFALDKGSDKQQVFSIATILSSAGFIAVLVLSPILLLFDSLRDYYWFVLLYYVSLWLYNIFSNYVKGLDKLGITTTAGIIHTFGFLGLNILFLAVFKIGIIGYLLAIDISNIIAAIFLFFYCKLYKQFISIKKLDLKLAKEMVRYSLPIIPDYISWWFVNCSDRYMLTGLIGTSVTGIYSVAYKIPTILSSLSSIFASAWKISSVDEFGTEESIRFYNKIFLTYSALLFSASAVLIVATRPLARILFTNDFYQAWEITPVLIVAYVLSALAIFVSSIFTASKQTKRLFYAPVIGAIINITLNFVLIPYWGGMGAACATCVGYFVILSINMYNTYKILPMNFVIGRNLLLFVLIAFETILIIYNNRTCDLGALMIVLVIFIITRNELRNLIVIPMRRIPVINNFFKK